MLTELFVSNLASTIVVAGGMSSPEPGTQETLTVSESNGIFPVVHRGVEQFHFKDRNPANGDEIFRCIETDREHWTVIRGAEETRTVAHGRRFSIRQVTTAGFFQRLGMGSTTELLNAVTVGSIDRTGGEDAGARLSSLLTVGPVYLPTGRYLLKQPLNVPPGAVMISYGDPILAVDPHFSAQAAIELIDGRSRVLLEGFTLDGSRLGAGMEVCGILCEASRLETELRSLRILGFPSDGLITSGNDYTLERVFSNNNHGDGFVILDEALLIGCRATGNTGYGFDATDATLIGCRASDNRKGDFRQ
jgi:hypothetical protein